MDDMNAFERQVAGEFVRRGGPARPVDVAAVFTAITTTQSPKWRFQSMFSATKFVVAGVIVALFGGFLLSGVSTQLSQDAIPEIGASASPESTARPIELPAQIPDRVDSGRLDTPLGSARWVHLVGDEITIPSSLQGLTDTPDGYEVLEWSSTPALWRSPDLITWTREALGVPPGVKAGAGALVRADGTYWLTTDGLWRSPDGRSWEQLDLGRLATPDPAGFAWRLQLELPGTTLVHDGIVIVPLLYQPDPWVLVPDAWVQAKGLRRSGTWPQLREIDTHVYDVFGKPGQGKTYFIGTLRFEETASGLRIVDNDDGTELAVLDGISMAFVERLASGGDLPSVFGFGILEGDALVDVELPGDTHSIEDRALTADDTGFTFYSLAPDGLVHVRHSSNGHDWTEVDVIGDDPGEPADITGVSAWTGYPVIDTDHGGWKTDGVRWERPPGDFSAGQRFASGWIGPMGGRGHGQGPKGVAENLGRGKVWTRFRPIGGDPTPIDLTEIGIASEDCPGRKDLISPNTQFSSPCGQGGAGPREIWIMTFDEVPA